MYLKGILNIDKDLQYSPKVAQERSTFQRSNNHIYHILIPRYRRVYTHTHTRYLILRINKI